MPRCALRRRAETKTLAKKDRRVRRARGPRAGVGVPDRPNCAFCYPISEARSGASHMFRFPIQREAVDAPLDILEWLMTGS